MNQLTKDGIILAVEALQEQAEAQARLLAILIKVLEADGPKIKAIIPSYPPPVEHVEPFPVCFHCIHACCGDACLYVNECNQELCIDCNFFDLCKPS